RYVGVPPYTAEHAAAEVLAPADTIEPPWQVRPVVGVAGPMSEYNRESLEGNMRVIESQLAIDATGHIVQAHRRSLDATSGRELSFLERGQFEYGVDAEPGVFALPAAASAVTVQLSGRQTGN